MIETAAAARQRTSHEVRTYEALGSALNPVQSLVQAGRDLYWSRHILWHLFRRDFVAGFRQKLLGYLWIVLVPLLGIASFVFMHWTGILNPGATPFPYAIYVYVGTSVWALFMASLGTVANGLIANTDLVMRTNIPKIGLAVTGMASLAYTLCVNTVVLVLLLLVFRMKPSAWILLYPLAMLPIVLLGAGLGLILSVVGAVARDVTGMATTLLNLVMYVTPVVYTAQFSNPWLKTIVELNPLTYLVDTPRSVLALGTVPSPTGFALATLLSLMVLWIGVHSFYLIKDKVAERL
jgi:ABC-type polysaccharide/polyol phosphate export permease